MSKTVEVFWTPMVTPLGNQWEVAGMHLLIQEPEPLITAIGRERKEARYLDCPAFIDMCRNVFVVRAPVTFNFKIDTPTQRVGIDRFGQTFGESFVSGRFQEAAVGGPNLVTLPPKILFYAKEPVTIEQMDVPVLASPLTQVTKVIPGRFDISKWIRPVEWSCEVLREVDVLNIVEGTPILCVRFVTKDGAPVKLTRVQQTDELVNMTMACTGVKTLKPGLKLAQSYELAKDYIAAWWRNK